MLRSTAFLPNSTRVSSRWIFAAAGLLVLATFATYWNSLSLPFFFDDLPAIVDNPSIRKLGALGEVLSPPRSGSGVTGRPLVNLSLAINYAIGGTNVTSYHLTNILLHALAGLALFGVVRRSLLLPSLRARFGEAALPLAFAVAAIWTLHPLQTESVTCVIQRTEVLVGLFYLLTLYGSIRVMDTPGEKRWFALAVGACLLGMASKEVMVSAPFMVLLHDRTFTAGSFAGAWRERRSLYVALGASLILLAIIVVTLGGTRGEVAGFGVGVTWWSYALKQCDAILRYLWLALWPHPLVVFYGVDVVTDPREVWWQIIVLTALVAGEFIALWRRPVLGFLGMWFFAILAPSSSVIPLVSQTMAEHRMYLPLAAVVTLGVVAFRQVATGAWFRCAVVLIVAFGIISARRNRDYRSPLAIWTDTVMKVPQNDRARVNLGITWQSAGHPQEALAEFQEALRLKPNTPEALNALASLLLEHERAAEAVEPARVAVQVKPNFVEAQNNLGTALVQTGHVAEGIEHLETALRLQPGLAEANCNLAGAYIALQQFDRAIDCAQQALRAKPNLTLAHYYLALALIQSNRREAGMRELEIAVQLQPTYADAQSTLGSVYYQAGDPKRAIPHYEIAMRAKPNFVEAHNNLASALSQVGNIEGAIEHYRTAIRLQPNYAEAHFNLGLILARSGRNNEAVAEYLEALRLRPDDARAQSELKRLGVALPSGAASQQK